MGLSVGNLVPFASADLMDFLMAEGGKGATAPAAPHADGFKPPACVAGAGGLLLAHSLKAPSAASGGLDSLAALFGDALGGNNGVQERWERGGACRTERVAISRRVRARPPGARSHHLPSSSNLPPAPSLLHPAAPPAMLSSYDDLDAASDAPLPWPLAPPPLPPAVERVLSARAPSPASPPHPEAAEPPRPPRPPRVAVSPAAAAALATAAASAALAGAPPPSLPPLKKGKRKAVALDDISDLAERRRQRRLAKNRATAAVSRERKHAQMQALAVTVYDLQKRNAALTAALAAKEAELAAVRGGGVKEVAGAGVAPPAAPRTAAPSTRRASRRAGGGDALASIDE